MKHSTKQMLIWGLVILVIGAIAYFAFFRNKDAEHTKQTSSTVDSTMKKIDTATNIAETKDEVTKQVVADQVEQAATTAAKAEAIKTENPEKAKEVAKVAEKQATKAVVTAAKGIPNAPPMAPSAPYGIPTGPALQSLPSDKQGDMMAELKAKFAEREKQKGGEYFRYFYGF